MGAERKAKDARARRRGFLRGRANARREKALQWVPVDYPDADRLAEPRRQPANRECPPGAGEPFLVPEFIARHQDPVVQVLTERMMLFYGRRKSFQRPLLNRQSGLVVPAFPELLQRPRKRCKKGETPSDPKPDFQWRRSDHMQPVIRVLLVLVGCCDWVSMEVMDPRGGYLSVARIAELAKLPVEKSAPADPEERARLHVSRTEHALQTLRTAGIVCFTKQHREKLEDGRHVSTGPALRKLAVGFFRKFGGEILRVFERRRRKVEAKRQLEAPTTSDLRIAAEIRETRRLMSGHKRTPPATTPGPRSKPRSTPQWLIDQVQSEDLSRPFDEVLREARRRLERGPPHAGPSANDTEPA